MELTLQMVEEVMEKAGASYWEAKQALSDQDGDVEKAVSSLCIEETPSGETAEDISKERAEEETEELEDLEETETLKDQAEPLNAFDEAKQRSRFASGKAPDTDELIEKLKNLVRKGNVNRILIRRKDEVLLNLPVNAGVIGGVVALAAIPWGVIGAAVTVFGLSACKVEIVKEDGSTEDVS